MTIVKYIGEYQPSNMLVDVEDEEVEKLIASGYYKRLEKKLPKVIEHKEVSYDNSKRIKE